MTILVTIFGTMIAFYLVHQAVSRRGWPAPLFTTLVIILTLIAVAYGIGSAFGLE